MFYNFIPLCIIYVGDSLNKSLLYVGEHFCYGEAFVPDMLVYKNF